MLEVGGGDEYDSKDDTYIGGWMGQGCRMLSRYWGGGYLSYELVGLVLLGDPHLESG